MQNIAKHLILCRIKLKSFVWTPTLCAYWLGTLGTNLFPIRDSTWILACLTHCTAPLLTSLEFARECTTHPTHMQAGEDTESPHQQPAPGTWAITRRAAPAMLVQSRSLTSLTLVPPVVVGIHNLGVGIHSPGVGIHNLLVTVAGGRGLPGSSS